jgi:Icc protein
MLIAQISDLHIAEVGARVRQRVDTNASLEDCVRYLNGLTRRPDVVLATGDLTDDGFAEQYGLLRDILDPLTIRLLLIPGNHDEREPFRKAYGHDHLELPDEGPIQYVVDDYDVRLVAVDTMRIGHHDGELDAARLAWLDATLAAAPDRPTLVFMHHPPFETGIWWMDCIGLAGAAEFRSVIARHPQVRRVIAGHIHRPIETSWGLTTVSVAPSTGMQTQCNLDPDHAPMVTDEGGLLQLHWYHDDTFVSHTTPFVAPRQHIDLSTALPDWPLAKARIKQGAPFAKGGMFG